MTPLEVAQAQSDKAWARSRQVQREYRNGSVRKYIAKLASEFRSAAQVGTDEVSTRGGDVAGRTGGTGGQPSGDTEPPSE